MDKDDKLPDLFPDLIYTFLLQLSSSQGPEAVSPVLKTWRLVHTGTLPEEINLKRYSCGQWPWAGRGLRLLLRSHQTPRVTFTERPLPSPLGGEKSPEADVAHTTPSRVSSTAQFSEFADLPTVSCDRPLAP